jgi:2-polyprenyl-6-methoxyphenol hydroxylase-like FAD-dependent oxidoreductase
LNTELLHFEQDDEGVTATLRVRSESQPKGHEESVRVDFMVGASGAKGTITPLIHSLHVLGIFRNCKKTVRLDFPWSHRTS